MSLGRIAATLLVGCILATAGGARCAAPPATDRPESVSLIRLIAAPEAYEGKMVQVVGYVWVEHEGTGVYLHREDFENCLFKNGLALVANDVTPEGSKEAAAHGRYAIIEGRFTANSRGHMGLWSGQIGEIGRMEAWAVRDGRK